MDSLGSVTQKTFIEIPDRRQYETTQALLCIPRRIQQAPKQHLSYYSRWH